MKWLARIVLLLIALWVTLFATVAIAMNQTPERFGKFMRHAPAPLVWGALPAKHLWLWAREGELSAGDVAPDFTLPRHRGAGSVTLSQHRGRPVVLVFGSYT